MSAGIVVNSLLLSCLQNGINHLRCSAKGGARGGEAESPATCKHEKPLANVVVFECARLGVFAITDTLATLIALGDSRQHMYHTIFMLRTIWRLLGVKMHA